MLMEGQPLVVRVALVLKLYQVPSDAYRVGKTRIFFQGGAHCVDSPHLKRKLASQ